jgi:hypothetical protein
MGRTALTVVLVHALFVAASAAQSTATKSLATVRITVRVMANGTPLTPGTYELRLTQEGPASPAGQSPVAAQWVEFVANGKTVAREVPIVLRDDALPPTGASSKRVPDGTRVEMLKGGDFLRVSIKRAGERYLIYLPVVS